MRVFLILALVPLSAAASEGRSLPRGEYPAVVERVFDSPRGEVQFTARVDGHSAFLRNHKGALTGLQEVRGPAVCDEWIISEKKDAPPAGCEFLFRDDHEGTYFSVRTEEMTEGSLFHSVRGAVRGNGPHVTL